MESNYMEHRFYSADPTRCYRRMHIPIQISHPEFSRPIPNGKMFDYSILRISSIDKSFQNWAKSLGLIVDQIRFFRNKPHYQYPFHIDDPKKDDQTACLNFAFDDRGTRFSWANLKEGAVPSREGTLDRGFVYRFHNSDDFEVILNEEIHHEYNQPFLINTGHIHSLTVSDTHRYCYSYSFRKISDKKRLYWDDAILYFKEYII